MSDEVKARRSDWNRAHYARAMKTQRPALLRLDADELGRLDAACRAAGLSRPAFAKLYLLPIADALAGMFSQIESARAASGLSLATFVERALAQAVANRARVDAPPAAAFEFDDLFAGDGERTC